MASPETEGRLHPHYEFYATALRGVPRYTDKTSLEEIEAHLQYFRQASLMDQQQMVVNQCMGRDSHPTEDEEAATILMQLREKPWTALEALLAAVDFCFRRDLPNEYVSPYPELKKGESADKDPNETETADEDAGDVECEDGNAKHEARETARRCRNLTRPPAQVETQQKQQQVGSLPAEGGATSLKRRRDGDPRPSQGQPRKRVRFSQPENLSTTAPARRRDTDIGNGASHRSSKSAGVSIDGYVNGVNVNNHGRNSIVNVNVNGRGTFFDAGANPPNQPRGKCKGKGMIKGPIAVSRLTHASSGHCTGNAASTNGVNITRNAGHLDQGSQFEPGNKNGIAITEPYDHSSSVSHGSPLGQVKRIRDGGMPRSPDTQRRPCSETAEKQIEETVKKAQKEAQKAVGTRKTRNREY